MSSLVELTASIIASQAASTSMSSEELLKSIQLVHATLKSLENADFIPSGPSTPMEAPKMSVKQSFKSNDNVLCMICGNGYVTLKRHLKVAHDMTSGQYRKQFGIPSTQTLAAKNYVESRRKEAIGRGQGEILAKARTARFPKVTKTDKSQS